MSDHSYHGDCRSCKFEDICKELPEDMTCEEVKQYAKDKGYQPV